jgi:TolB-like protein
VNATGSAEIFEFARFRLNLQDLSLWRLEQAGAEAVELGRRAREVLAVLLEAYPAAVDRRKLLEVWPRPVADANVDIQIQNLRRRIDPNSSIIGTVHAEGFRIIVPVIRLGPVPRLSIVVLPFVDLSEDKKQQYFADGITDDLTMDLSRIEDMVVISRNTAFAYRGKSLDSRQIGQELGVRYLLEGSVRRAGPRVRINVQLIDTKTDAQLWADRRDCQFSDLFELQDDITSGIIGAIEPQLLKFERDRIASLPRHSEDA